jgi:hypothetical protein
MMTVEFITNAGWCGYEGRSGVECGQVRVRRTARPIRAAGRRVSDPRSFDSHVTKISDCPGRSGLWKRRSDREERYVRRFVVGLTTTANVECHADGYVVILSVLTRGHVQ